MSQPTPATPQSGIVAASSENAIPWGRILVWCLAFTVPAVLITAILGLIAAGTPGLLSTLAVGGVVIVFFAISLLVGTVVGHLAPKGLMASFLIMYIVKVIAFGAFLLVPQDPAWFSKAWVTAGAVVAILVWQGVEMYRFTRVRLQIFDTDTPAAKAQR